MENKDFRIYAVLTAAASIMVPATYIVAKNWAAAGILTLGSIKLLDMAEEKAKKNGRTRKVRTILSLLEPLTEIAVLSAGLIAITGSGDLLTSILGYSVIGTIALSEIFRKNLKQRLREQIHRNFSRDVLIAVAGVTYLVATLEPFILYYGMSLAGVLAFYNTLEILYRTYFQH